jgi:hypothetical protein
MDLDVWCRPTFLGIGSLRCGSTWLYQVLKCHPDIHLSERKEVNYFFSRKMLRLDLNWYESHFKPRNGDEPKPVRGDISPPYGRLQPWQVNRIAELLPELRIILTLRHPIDRTWSQALLEFGYLDRKDVRQISSIDFVRQVERARNRMASDYHRMIQIWSNAFGSDALHIDLFDQLQEDPQTYVNGVLRHIGATTPWCLPTKFIKTKVHATSSLVGYKRQIPDVVQWYIADRLLEPTERLNELLEGRLSSWVDDMRSIRGKARLSWRLLRELNLAVLSIPEKLAYEAYHAVLDVRLWLRWRQLRRSYIQNGYGAVRPASDEQLKK